MHTTTISLLKFTHTLKNTTKFSIKPTKNSVTVNSGSEMYIKVSIEKQSLTSKMNKPLG